jgi:hypothetical protein
MGAPLKDGAKEEEAVTLIGLDLHKRYITAYSMTEDGPIVAEERRVVLEVAALEGRTHRQSDSALGMTSKPLGRPAARHS